MKVYIVSPKMSMKQAMPPSLNGDHPFPAFWRSKKDAVEYRNALNERYRCGFRVYEVEAKILRVIPQ